MVLQGVVGIPLELLLRAGAARFLRQMNDAGAIAHRTLQRILTINGATEWGRRYRLNSPHALEAFREIPPTSYQDYLPFIERAAHGEPRVLTGEPITYFAMTSGTTGPQKLIPVTRRQSRGIAELMVVPMGLALKSGALGPIHGRSLMIATEQINGVTPGGIPKGAGTSNGLRRIGGRFRDTIWTSPLPVLQIQDQLANRYLHLLFALGETHLWTISAFFPSTLLFVLRDLHTYADELLRDLADGTITRRLELPEQFRKELEQRLHPNPHRARLLASMRQQGRFTVRDIWPEVRVVFSAGSGTFRFYVDQLKPYLGDVQVFSSAYASSESAIGVGLSPNQLGYALAPMAAYHEFLPLADAESPNVRPLGLNEIELGQEYEVLVTTYSGLTRYRLGDIVRVVGCCAGVPMIDFVERRGQVINIVGEKTGEAQIARAFEAACREISAQVLDYIVTSDPRYTPARYVLLVEELSAASAGDSIARAFDAHLLLETFERQLFQVASDYADGRRMGELGPMVLRILPPGTFERFRAMRVATGASAAQVKVPHVITDPSLLSQYFLDNPLREVVSRERV